MRNKSVKHKYLTPDEERGLVLLAVDGDKEAAGELVLRFMPMIRNLAKRRSKTPEDFQDQTGNGMLAIYHAIERFKPELNTRFSVYAWRWVAYFMQRYNEPVPAMTGINENIDIEDGVDYEEKIMQSEEVDILHEYLATNAHTFSPREKDILELRIQQGISIRDLAAHLGISKQRAHNLEYDLVHKIRKAVRLQCKNLT